MRANKHSPRIEPRVTDVTGGCKRANVGKDRFYELLNSGEIESYLDGRARKVLLASVDAYIDRQIAHISARPLSETGGGVMTGWRDHLKVHPAAELFPPMSEPDLRELGEDIKAHGLKSHLKLYKGLLLDGRNRLAAMELVGITPDLRDDTLSMGCPFDHLDERADPYEYVISANLHRRHLTSEQKRDLIAKVLKAKPAVSNATVAKQVKADDKTVAKVRRKLESTSEIPKLEKTVGADGKRRPPRRRRSMITLEPNANVTFSDKPRVRQLEISVEQRRRENTNIGMTAAERSKQNLEWFAVACREYLPNISVERDRQEARRLVAELTTAGDFSPTVN